MPRSRERAQHIRAQRWREILDAAIPAFATKGFSQTTLSEIAGIAGISHGTVALHFGTKDALFRAAVLEPLTEFERALHVPDVPEESVRPVLERMARDHVAIAIGRRRYLRLLSYVLSQADRFPDLAEQVAFGPRFAKRLAPLLVAGERRGEVEPGRALIAGTAYLAYLFGLSQVVLIDAESPAWAEYATRATRILGLRS